MEQRASRVGVTLSETRPTGENSFDKIIGYYEKDLKEGEDPKKGLEECESQVRRWLNPEQRAGQPQAPNQNGALRILTHARQNCPDQSEKALEKITVREFQDHYKVSSPFFGTDETGRKLFARFAGSMKEVGGVWDSEPRPDKPDKRFYFFRIPKPR